MWPKGKLLIRHRAMWLHFQRRLKYFFLILSHLDKSFFSNCNKVWACNTADRQKRLEIFKINFWFLSFSSIYFVHKNETVTRFIHPHTINFSVLFLAMNLNDKRLGLDSISQFVSVNFFFRWDAKWSDKYIKIWSCGENANWGKIKMQNTAQENLFVGTF